MLKNELIEVAAGYLKLQISIDDVIEVLPESEPAPYLPENVAVKNRSPLGYNVTRDQCHWTKVRRGL